MLRTPLLSSAFATVCLLGPSALCLQAQQMTQAPPQPISARTPDPGNQDYRLFGKTPKKGAPIREILGQVIDPSSTPVAGAVVSLKRVGGDKARELISDKNGKFLFDGLSRTDDYVLTASLKGKKPVERKISQFDARERIQLMLQLEPDDSKAPAAKPADTSAAK